VRPFVPHWLHEKTLSLAVCPSHQPAEVRARRPVRLTWFNSGARERKRQGDSGADMRAPPSAALASVI